MVERWGKTFTCELKKEFGTNTLLERSKCMLVRTCTTSSIALRLVLCFLMNFIVSENSVCRIPLSTSLGEIDGILCPANRLRPEGTTSSTEPEHTVLQTVRKSHGHRRPPSSHWSTQTTLESELSATVLSSSAHVIDVWKRILETSLSASDVAKELVESHLMPPLLPPSLTE